MKNNDMHVDTDDLRRIHDQHIQLRSLLKTACRALKNSHRHVPPELSGILARLLKLTGNHFSEEEELMRSCAHEGWESHKRSHDVLLNTFAELKRNSFLFDESDRAALLRFLEKDFYYHVVEDQHAWMRLKVAPA